MNQIAAIVLREMIILKRKFLRYFFSFSVSPLLYLIAFGWAGHGRVSVDGVPYSVFMLPGLVAMSSMLNSFSIATEINISRFYWRTFDEIRSAPVTDFAYVFGEVISGIIRGSLAAIVVVLLGVAFSVLLPMNPWLYAGIALNAFIFSSIAVSVAMLARSHADQGMLTGFVITPMAFLCGTFFPVEYYPWWIQGIVKMLPLTHASRAIRASCLGQPVPSESYVYMAATGIACFIIAVLVVRQSKN